MSNLAQFLGQYSNGNFSEIVDGSVIDISFSKINKFIALGSLTSVGINVLNASLNTYLSVETINNLAFSTSNTPTQTSGVQVNFPSNIGQLLVDNTIPQGLWTPYFTGNVLPNNSYVTYGRATDLFLSTVTKQGNFKASVVISSTAVLICVSQGSFLNLYVYNPVARTLGPVTSVNSVTLTNSLIGGTQVVSKVNVVNLFSTGTNTFLLTLGYHGSLSGTFGAFGAIALTISGTSITVGSPMSFTGSQPAANDGTAMMTASWVQLTSTQFALAYYNQNAAQQISIVGVVVNPSTNTVTKGSEYGHSVSGTPYSLCDLIAHNASGVFILHKGTGPNIYLSSFLISGTSTPTLVSANISTGYGIGTLDTTFVHKINTTDYISFISVTSPDVHIFKGFSVNSSLVITLSATPQAAFTYGGSNNIRVKWDHTYRRTEAFRVRSGDGLGPQYISASNTYLVPLQTGLAVYGMSGFTVTSSGGSVMTILTSGNTAHYFLKDHSNATPTYYMFSDSGTCQYGRKINISGTTSSIDTSDIINTDQSSFGYQSQIGYMFNSNKAFGRYRLPSNYLKQYNRNKANPYYTQFNNSQFSGVETSITLDGSSFIASNQSSADTSVGSTQTELWLVDGST